ncbi:MAG: type I toxin-antitoxin system SymE family toxin [Oribacterium sp.]|nr:type I toxin-antitoxin system SymE family toxin [Oribacterium sp.]
MTKKNRSIKVYGMSGYKYQSTPTIMLKGNWLRDLGFEIGDYISISCENGKLVITPDAEKAAMKEAEAAFMEREMKSLQKRLEAEKKKLHLQYVAERKAEYGVAEGV